MQKTDWRGQECPPLYTVRRNGGLRQVSIYIDVHEDESGWAATEITLPTGMHDYGTMVSALITAKYDIDRMQAVINNYLIEPTESAYEEAFNVMQEWRKEAKRIAREIDDELSSNE